MRHLEVDRIIEQRNIKTFIDLGCSEALLIQKLSRSENIELAVGVDRDSTAVSTAVLVLLMICRTPSLRISNSLSSSGGSMTSTYLFTEEMPPASTGN